MNPKTQFLEHELGENKNEYEDHMRGFYQLDNKTIQVIGFSGVILGLSISFLKEDTIEFLSNTHCLLLYLVFLSIVFLLMSILFGILGIWITNIKGVPSYKYTIRYYRDLKSLDKCEFKVKHYNNFLSTKIEKWKVSIESIKLANKKKAKKVFLAQLFCSIGLSIFGLIGIILVITNI